MTIVVFAGLVAFAQAELPPLPPPPVAGAEAPPPTVEPAPPDEPAPAPKTPAPAPKTEEEEDADETPEDVAAPIAESTSTPDSPPGDDEKPIPPVAPPTDEGAAPSPQDLALPILLRAMEQVQRGELNEAYATLEQVLDIDPQNLDALRALGLVAVLTQRPGEAILFFKTVLRLDPNDDKTRLDLARAQWATGQPDSANSRVTEILTRHPEMPAALDLQGRLARGEAPVGTGWRLIGRAATALHYDSNINKAQNRDFFIATGFESARMLLEVRGGVTRGTEKSGLTAIAHWTMQTTFHTGSNRGIIERALPTGFGLTLRGNLALGPLRGGLDLRYDEVFSSFFENHLFRRLTPTATLAYPINDQHAVQGLFGVSILEIASFAGNSSFQASVRYLMSMESLTLVVDVGGERNTNTTFGSSTGWTDARITSYAEVPLIAGLDLVGLFEIKNRKFNQGNAFAEQASERTLVTSVGVRYTLGIAELHAEYGLTANLSDDPLFTYYRHQVGGGVRVWFPWED